MNYFYKNISVNPGLRERNEDDGNRQNIDSDENNEDGSIGNVQKIYRLFLNRANQEVSKYA